MPTPLYWQRKRRRPSAKTRDAVLWALRGGIAMNPHDLAGEANMPHGRVCAALNDLLIRERVERDDSGRYRRTDREAVSA
jgi:predicted Rossmann fold nucleotide-binding protein DprA/Smf involved in DNA uptake